MSLEIKDDASRSLYEASRAYLRERKGHILTFASFAKAFPDYTREQLALNIEYLCRKECMLLKKVYVFSDESYGPTIIDERLVHEYLRGGVFYHPANSSEIVDDADEHIFVEFEVI